MAANCPITLRSMPVAGEELTRCGSCGRDTKTIGGLCAHCGVLKDASQAPRAALEPRKLSKGSVWDDPVLTVVLIVLAPAIALIVLGLVIGAELLLIIGILLLGLALVAKVAGDG
jgi:hypothetical protein